jgi:tRNA-dihydrouridine synthase A
VKVQIDSVDIVGTHTTALGTQDPGSRRISIAPMLDWSDRHYRRFLRILAPRALLYTEMVVAEAILRGDPARLLGYSDCEHPLAVQLGGSDPVRLAAAARVCESFGFDEINLNVGCPSERVQNATFGACLMAYPERVADCVAAMRAAVRVPVTVKCRIGIDDQDEQSTLHRFVAIVAAAGCDTFIVHARKAILGGLTPKQNRDIPPLRYEIVYALKAARPDLHITINGGIRTVGEAQAHWQRVDGVMVGREAYHNPYRVPQLEAAAFGTAAPVVEPAEVIERLRPYVEDRLAAGDRLHSISRHLLGLYAHRSGARAFRRVLSERAGQSGAGFGVLEAAVRAAQGSSIAA